MILGRVGNLRFTGLGALLRALQVSLNHGQLTCHLDIKTQKSTTEKKAHVISILQSYRLVLNDFINGYKTYVTTYATRETCPALKGVERSSDTLRRHLGPLALRAFTMSGKLGRVVKKPSGNRICLE